MAHNYYILVIYDYNHIIIFCLIMETNDKFKGIWIHLFPVLKESSCSTFVIYDKMFICIIYMQNTRITISIALYFTVVKPKSHLWGKPPSGVTVNIASQLNQKQYLTISIYIIGFMFDLNNWIEILHTE